MDGVLMAANGSKWQQVAASGPDGTGLAGAVAGRCGILLFSIMIPIGWKWLLRWIWGGPRVMPESFSSTK
jgi:hypothetical protein